MTEFTELLFNPITIIATLLALFFVLMAFRRNRNTGRLPSRPEDTSEAKPYRVANPYSPAPAVPNPASAPAPAAPPATLLQPPASPTPAPPRRVFRQFGQSALQPDANPADGQTGYVWE
ncbi:MAG TPA: hypothetical protein P5306_07145 [Kiritimatiellia bacterium]|nr:hypothetical protein [Kiritimatiellia bacterium]HRX06853.1 hypothetical protein [Kiritimatiellia bacterium]